MAAARPDGSLFLSLHDEGFAVFPKLLTSEGIVSLLSAAAGCVTDQDINISGREVMERHPEIILPLICSPLVLDTCEAAMGPFVQLDSFSVVSLKSNGHRGISWHRDVYGSVPRSTVFERPLALNLLVYLQDLTPEVGPLRLIRGSHRAPLLMSDAERSRPHPSEELVYLSAGDGIIIHNNLVHSRSPNFSGAARVHLSVVYTLAFMKSSIDTERNPLLALRNNAQAMGNQRITRLLGDDPHAENRFNSGFLRSDGDAWNEWIAADRLHSI